MKLSLIQDLGPFNIYVYVKPALFNFSEQHMEGDWGISFVALVLEPQTCSMLITNDNL